MTREYALPEIGAYEDIDAKLVTLFAPWGTLWGDDLSQVTAAIAAEGPVLDLGCGTGRVTLEIAQARTDVWGIDSSAAMLALCKDEARRRSVEIQLVHGSIASLGLPQKFAYIYASSGTFELLHNKSIAAQALESYADHLVPGGRLSLSIVRQAIADEDHNLWRLRGAIGSPESAERFTVEEATAPTDDPACLDNIRRITELDESGIAVCTRFRRHRLRMWPVDELRASVEVTGLRVESVEGTDGDYVMTARRED